jgi:hypothetical protein
MLGLSLALMCLHPSEAQSIFRKSGFRFSVRKCDNAKKLEWFLFSDNVKPLETRGLDRSGSRHAKLFRTGEPSGRSQLRLEHDFALDICSIA